MTLKAISKKAAVICEKIGSLEDLESLTADAREYFDGKSERWQEGEAGQEYLAAVEALESAFESMTEAVEQLNSIGE